MLNVLNRFQEKGKDSTLIKSYCGILQVSNQTLKVELYCAQLERLADLFESLNHLPWV